MINWISLVFFVFFSLMYTWAPTIWFLFWKIFRQIGQFGGKPCPEFFSQCWIQLGDPKGFWFFDPSTFCTRCLFKTKLTFPKFLDFVVLFFVLLGQIPITNFHSSLEIQFHLTSFDEIFRGLQFYEIFNIQTFLSYHDFFFREITTYHISFIFTCR